MARGRNGLGYGSSEWFRTWPGQLAGLGYAAPERGATGFWNAPWSPPSLNPADYAAAGSGGSHDFPAGGYPTDYSLYPSPGTGGSRVGTGFHGMGDAYTDTLAAQDAAGDYAGAFGGPAAAAGAEAAVIAGASSIRVTTEGALSFLQGTIFGLPRWAVALVAAAVAYKLYKGRR